MLHQCDHDLRKLRCIRDIGAIKVLARLLDQQVSFLYIVRVTGIIAVEGEVAVDALFNGVDGDKILANARSRRDGVAFRFVVM